ncbi:MAG TPA: hypothetical protein VJ951_01680, partial [Bacteroidales bacterium]|nr:hypothetical protein [Bacteroidales bacterium]
MTIDQVTELSTPVPQTSDPENFDDRADTLFSELPTMVSEFNTSIGQINSTVEGINTSEANVVSHASDAETSKDLAQAAANFVGKWSDQTGSASTGISVYHNSAFWALASNLADVTAKEPGIDTEWVQIVMELAIIDIAREQG